MPRPRAAPPASSLDTLTGRIAEEGTRTVVVLRGEADFSAGLVLSDILARGVSAGEGDVVIDLGGLRFIDSGAIRVLVAAQQRLQRLGRTLTLRSPTAVVTRVLGVFGLAGLVEILQTDETTRPAGRRR
jgi:anti-sigma B factor antagonist